ncbi:cytochrome P450 [Phanerochaete sordida]|uniref:Cytochrome P450 n=1 Tax=Phanerochaete sordida TaxID=48140 RepID=A0A9P3GN28_9APHY|nr:cytochrome P450 [Phanerochaete sordida]
MFLSTSNLCGTIMALAGLPPPPGAIHPVPSTRSLVHRLNICPSASAASQAQTLTKYLAMAILETLALIVATFFAIQFFKQQRRRYPPGPKGLPVVGNMFDVPLENGWRIFRDWSREYGSDIVHAETLGMHIVVVNSAKAAKDLFDGRPHIYSDKDRSTMVLELSGWRRAWASIPYGDSWREHRRIFNRHFRTSALTRYHPRQAKAAHRLLQLLLDAPQDFASHIRYASGSAILDVVYAFDALPGDPRLDLVERAMETLAEILHAGVFLLDVFPILKHVPAWLPGAQFKRKAAGYKKLVDAMFEVPYAQLKADMQEGKAQPCLTTSLLFDCDSDPTPERDEILMNIAGTAYAAGSDTSVSTLGIFVLAMVLYPEVQSFVQEEIDRVVGRDRLPEISDRGALPRVTALIQEVLRWHQPLPLGLPHRAMVDDEYNGYHIPAGSVVLGNAWAILHDGATYPDPTAFNPNRFLAADGALRSDVPFPTEVFGFGRRICPGRHFAMDTLFLTVASILAVFRIEHAVDDGGREVEVQEAFTPHGLSQAEPFKAHFAPRYAGAEDLVRATAVMD